VPRAARASIDPDRRAGRPAGQRLAALLLALLIAPPLLAGCITVNIGRGRPGPLQEVTIEGKGDAKVLLVDLTGIIVGETRLGLFGFSVIPSTVDRVAQQLEKAADDRAVKALVLRINSPGGTVAASDVLYHMVRRFKEKARVPVVACFLDLAASGGYYVAMASDQIVAHPATVTGSIGVIYSSLNRVGLYNKLGLADQTVKSGPYKDLWSASRSPTEEERVIVQRQLDDLFARFLATVQSGRPGLAPARLRALADGRTYTASQALAEGLVDRVGYMEDAVEAAKRRAGLKAARVIAYVRAGEERPTHLYASAPVRPPAAGAEDLLAQVAGEETPQFLYLWRGH
jgi:protease-4